MVGHRDIIQFECSTVQGFREHLSDGLVLAVFGAPWCQPCQRQSLILEQWSPQVEGGLTLIQVDAEDCVSLAREYEIEGLPTLMLFFENRLVQRLVGVQRLQDLDESIQHWIMKGKE